MTRSRSRNLGPPGRRNDESGPLGPATAERVDYQATHPHQHQPLITRPARSQYMADRRREGIKSPERR